MLWDACGRSRVFEACVESPIVSVAYSPNGRFVAAGSGSFATVWRVQDGHEEIGRAQVEGEVRVVALASRPADLLAVGTAAKVVLVSLPDLQQVAELEHCSRVNDLSFSPDGARLAVGAGTDDMCGLMTKKASGASQGSEPHSARKSRRLRGSADMSQSGALGFLIGLIPLHRCWGAAWASASAHLPLSRP